MRRIARAAHGDRWPSVRRVTQDRLHLSAVFAGAFFLIFGAGCGFQEPAKPKPKYIVLICLDTVRFDAFWLIDDFGPGDAFSRWAERAVRFDSTLATSPWTIPSVSSAITGLYSESHRAGSFSNEIANLDVQIPSPLPPEVTTLPEVLSDEGYETTAIVAHPWFRTGFGLDQGFDTTVHIPTANEILDEARARLAGADGERPVFLYLHLMEAHDRHMKGRRRAEESARSLPAEWRTATRRAQPCSDPTSRNCVRFQAYVGAIRDLRAGLANFLDGLAREGLLEDSIVALFSDHGEEFGEHLSERRRAQNDPRGLYGIGHGHSLYQELLHVPLLVWDPGRKGDTVNRPASLVDIPSTLLGEEWQGPRSERVFRGRDLLGSTGPRFRSRPRFFSGIAYGPRGAGVIVGHWKLTTTIGGSSTLHDLESDPLETDPVRNPRVSKRMESLIGEYLALRGSEGPIETPELDDDELEDLEAIGYLGGAASDR